jgi:hypothetical protein
VVYDGTQFIMTSPSANTVSPQNLVQASDVQKQTYTYWPNTSSTDSYIINPTPAVSSYTDGQRWYIYTSVGNTGACSLSVSGLASVPIKKMDRWSNLIDLDTGDISAGEIFVVVYNSAASCFVLVAPTRSREFPVNSCYIAQANPQTLLNYGTWSYVQPLYLGLFHFENNFNHHAYNGYYTCLSIGGGTFVTSPVKFGTYSLSLPCTSPTNTYFPPRRELQFGLQIDMWIRVSNTGVGAYLWGSSDGINWQFVTAGKIALYDGATQLLQSAAITANTWYHIAMAYWWDSNGRYVSMWLNGSRVGTVQTLTSTSVAFGYSNQIITRTDPNSYYMYVDELRIIDSTPTYGDTYTVPTAPYTPNGPLPYLWTRTA